MRTPLRALVATAISLGALVVAVTASASAPGPDATTGSGVASSAPNPGGRPSATCVITKPNCNDRSHGGDITDPQPQPVEPRPGMQDVRPTSFDTATIGDDDRSLTITFWSGVEPCSVLDHVDMAETPDAVRVTLYQGSDPSAGQVACIDIAVLKQVTVTLDHPLAGRDVVDGAP
jgi:hypothetical protein